MQIVCPDELSKWLNADGIGPSKADCSADADGRLPASYRAHAAGSVCLRLIISKKMKMFSLPDRRNPDLE